MIKNDKQFPNEANGEPTTPRREFHVRRDSRDRYEIKRSLYQLNGNVVLADMQATRRLAHKMNQERDLVRSPGSAVRAGDIHAMGLIDEIMHYVVDQYREQNGHAVFAEALTRLEKKFGKKRVDSCIKRFGELFPATSVYNGETSADDFLSSESEGRSGRELAFEEMMMLRLENKNPAFSPFAELFSDDELSREEQYEELVEETESFFADQPTFGPDDQPLLEMLQTPARLYPDSLEQQLAYMREHWGVILGEFLLRLLRGLDLLREEAKAGLKGMFGGGAGPARVYEYGGTSEDPERFSPDQEWMPKTVLMAKSTLVWLDQLTKQYGREINRLDQIPDEELDKLAGWGVTGLWLIGLWQRSRASKRIKNIMGNPDAEASAYALYDDEIADELGGWDALNGLRTRCWARGIRVASDMVPNHVGIDGKWVIEHPDWFIQVDETPFPSYTFESENLSEVPGVGIHLEDHYYSKSDAAVVFKRVDHDSGRTRYFYHGNDGTSMPWNDTAKLDYPNPEVREAVIQTILHVARNFPIIRFDAAMTLAKKHIQRLWYPQPGSGGDIASRAEHGLPAEEFEQAIPVEFWREVVDRVAAEVPDTLLLAEAFWMMEGYFVRTLGMHRVYNSAFMNMLKNEDNGKYRRTIKNTIEFDKDILKRFVNFMNNPDEETAVAQFGTGDKYVGVCTLMVTMPGLPMIGHGQIEGFTEKYGMEYRRAYLDEQPNRELVARHEREIFPLMRRRYLFSGVDNFLLFDLYDDNGNINENVFAYSNRAGGERGLVLYNNSYERAWGWIKTSSGYVEKQDGRREHRQTELAEGLGIGSGFDRFTIFRDQRSGLWFIRRSSQISEAGLFVELKGYQCHVFLDFYEVQDNHEGHYAQLFDELQGAGVPDVERAVRDVALKPLLDLFGGVANSQSYHNIAQAITGKAALPDDECARLQEGYDRFLDLATKYAEPVEGAAGKSARICENLDAAQRIPFLNLEQTGSAGPEMRATVKQYTDGLDRRPDRADLLATWILLEPLSALYDYPVGICEDWGIIARAERAFQTRMHDHDWVEVVKLLVAHGTWWAEFGETEQPLAALFASMLSDAVVTNYLGLNEYNGVVYFNKERLEELRWWLMATGLVGIEKAGGNGQATAVKKLHASLENLDNAQEAAEYQIEKLLAGLTGDTKPRAKSAGRKAGNSKAGESSQSAGKATKKSSSKKK